MIKIYVSSFVFPDSKEGGYATIIKNNNMTEIIISGQKNTMKKRMELLAIVRGLEQIKEKVEVEVYSDQKEIIRKMDRLNKVDIIEIKNTDLWRRYLTVSTDLKIKTKLIDDMNETEETRECFSKALVMAMKIKDNN